MERQILVLLGLFYLSVGMSYVTYKIPTLIKVIKRDKWDTDFKRILWSSFNLIFFWAFIGAWLLFEEIK